MKAQRKWISIADVRASQRLDLVSLPILLRWLVVPAAWPITLLAYRLRWPPNAVTAGRGLMVLVSMFFIADPNTLSFGVGIALYLLALLADSVDGNLCRLLDRATYFGKFADGLVDSAAELMFPVALGVHVWRSQGDASAGVLLASCIGSLCLAVMFLLILRSTLMFTILETSLKDGVQTPSDVGLLRFFRSHPLGKCLLVFDAAVMNVMFDIRYLGLVGALVVSRIDLYVYALSAMYVVFLLGFGLTRTLRVYATLNVHRRSRSAA